MKKFFFSILITCITGCGGGFNCPFNVPNCCFDTLFGCGIFDLPAGCSCSSYGFFRLPISTPSFTKVKASKEYQGTWSGILKRKYSSCASLLKEINGLITVTQRKKGVTVTVPRYGKLYGKKQSKGFYATGKYNPPMTGCSAKVDVMYNKYKKNIGTASANITYSCDGEVMCTAQYSGALQRQ